MSEYERQTVLCVDDTLATGRRVVFAYGGDGDPICCWDAAELSSVWLDGESWHPARVAVGLWAPSQGASTPLPTLQPREEAVLVAWLAKTYQYLEPLLGVHACALSSCSLFSRQIVSSLKHLSADADVLEIGGSDGVETVRGAMRCTGWAVDPSFVDADDSGKERIGRRRGIVEALPFPDGAFDAVLCLFVLEHLINPRMAMREMARVMKPEGILLLGIPVASSPVGVPPFLHRWRFVFDGYAGAERTLLLANIADDAFGLTPSGLTAWRPVAQERDACLFKMRKASYG